PSVFHFSIRSFCKSPWVFLEVSSSCVSMPFNCVTDAYDTGELPWPFVGAAIGEGPDCASTTMLVNRKKTEERRRLRFISSFDFAALEYYKDTLAAHRVNPPMPEEAFADVL